MTSESRALVVDGLVNARDLGGLPLRGGGLTPSQVFVRSESPDLVSPAGWRALSDLGVRTLVDLRQAVERSREPTSPPDDLLVLAIDHDGLEHTGFWRDYWENGLVGTPRYYLPHLAALPERTVAVLGAIAGARPGTVLVHCGGGRDRTGLISAVLLRIAGVEEDAIVGDYLDSIHAMPALHALRGRPDHEGEIADLLTSLGTTSEAAFRDFLAGLDVAALLARLPPDRAHALRTWRGTLPAR